MRKITVLIALLSLPLSLLADPEVKGTPAELTRYLESLPKTVTISGEAEVRVPVHRAVISLKVTSENRSLQEALQTNLQLRNRLADHLRKNGIDPERVHASKFSSTPVYGIFGDKAKSYRVENLMRIAVQDEKEFQTAAMAVDQWSEVQFVAVDFEYADKEQLKAKAISDACDNANARKKTYEEKFGLKLTPVNLSEGTVTPRALNAGNYASGKIQGYGGTAPGSSAVLPSETYGAMTESFSSFGELIYSGRVTVECSVAGK